MKTNRTAEIGISMKGAVPFVELVVPSGTKFKDAIKLKDLLGQLVPKGCQACLSGFDFRIRERLDDVVRIDLDKMKVIGRI